MYHRGNQNAAGTVLVKNFKFNFVRGGHHRSSLREGRFPIAANIAIAKKTGYESRLAIFRNENDGWRHLAASVVERAVLDLENPNYKQKSKVKEWLVTDGLIWAEWAYPSVDKNAMREELCRKYAIADS